MIVANAPGQRSWTSADDCNTPVYWIQGWKFSNLLFFFKRPLNSPWSLVRGLLVVPVRGRGTKTAAVTSFVEWGWREVIRIYYAEWVPETVLYVIDTDLLHASDCQRYKLAVDSDTAASPEKWSHGRWNHEKMRNEVTRWCLRHRHFLQLPETSLTHDWRNRIFSLLVLFPFIYIYIYK